MDKETCNQTLQAFSTQINDLMNGIKAFQQERKADKNYELNSVLKYVCNRLDLADDELWVYMDKEE